MVVKWVVAPLLILNKGAEGGQRHKGKCVVQDTTIKVRNKITGLIEDIEIGKFYDKISKIS